MPKFRQSAILVRYTTPDRKRRYDPAVTSRKSPIPKVDRVLLRGKEHFVNDGVFVVRYKRHDRKLVYITAGTSPEAAYIMKQKIDLRLRDEDRGIEPLEPVPETTKEPKPDKDRRRVAVDADVWIDQARASRSPRTAFVYQKTIISFLKWTPKMFTDEIVTADITAYLEKLRQDGFADRSRFNVASILRTFFRSVGREDVVVSAIVPKYQEKVVSAYDPAEIEAMRAVASPEMRLWIDFMVSTGLREQEAMFACWQDIDEYRKLLHVRPKPEFGFTVKDGKERFVPLPQSVMSRLIEERSRSTNRLIFPSTGGNPDGHQLRKVKILHQKAGLNCGRCLTKSRKGYKVKSCANHPVCRKAELHKFRKTYATMLATSGMAIHTISKLLGHEDIQTTMRYLEAMSAGSPVTLAKVDSTFAFAS